MKRIASYQLIIGIVLILSGSTLLAQEQASSQNRLIFSLRAKILSPGPEISFEHSLSERFSIRTAIGFDRREKDERIYRNNELVVSMLSNSREYPYGFTVGPYLKLKYSNYDYYHPETEAMLDSYTRLYFFGAGVSAEYRQKIGQRFMVSPFARFGVNKVLLRDDYGPGEPFFTDSFETDPCLGLAVSFIF